MIKTYKPNPIKPVTSEIWAPVSLTDWKIDGESFIETQFEYVTKLNSTINREVPGMLVDPNKPEEDKAFLNYQIIPSIAYYGKVAVNPAGSLLVLDNKNIVGNTSLTEANVVGYNAIASLINQQRTDLDLTSRIKHAVDNNYPIIPLYMRALMYNTQTLIRPALHIKSMFGYLESLKTISNRAAIRITQILNKFKQNKFLKPYNEYLELLSTTPLHSETVRSLIDLFMIEKLNDAYNTSYDYICPQHTVKFYHAGSSFNVKDVFKITKYTDSGSKVNDINLLLDVDAEGDYFWDRLYIEELFKAINVEDDTNFSKVLRHIDGGLVQKCIDMVNKTISMISSIPTIFQPFYAAVPFLSEYIDTTIFTTVDVVNLEINIRKSCFYAKGNAISNIVIEKDTSKSIYPTWAMEVPLYNGSLKPSAPYNTNGILYLVGEDTAFDSASGANKVASLKRSTYVPFIDISNMHLTYAILATNKLVDYSDILGDNTTRYDVLDYEITTDNGKVVLTNTDFFLKLTKLNFDNWAGIIRVPVKEKYFQAPAHGYRSAFTDKLSALVHWVTFKSDHCVLSYGKNGDKNVIITSPTMTGYRTVSITPVSDTVRRVTSKLLGIKKINSLQ